MGNFERQRIIGIIKFVLQDGDIIRTGGYPGSVTHDNIGVIRLPGESMKLNKYSIIQFGIQDLSGFLKYR